MLVSVRAQCALTLAVFFSLPVSSLLAQVDCSTADNLCTGDPCVVGKIEVQTPCVVDFGARTLVVDEVLTLGDASVLDFTAGAIAVNGRIMGRRSNGPQVALTALDDITVGGSIDVSGRVTPGSLTLDAGGDIAISRRITSRPRGGPASGGTLDIHADGMLTSTSSGKLTVKAGRNVPGGTVLLNGDAGVALAGAVDARGDDGGAINVWSSSGSVTVGELDASSTFGTGGTIGVVSIAGAVVTTEDLEANSSFGLGGYVEVTAAGAVTAEGRLEADGDAAGGTVDVSGDTVVTTALVRARSNAGTGGIIGITSVGGTTVEAEVRVDSDAGGCVLISSSAGSVAVERKIRATGNQTDGGRVVLSAAGDLTLENTIGVTGHDNGGSASLSASNIVLNDVEARGNPGGTLEANATGDLMTAGARLSATVGGCIELTAGGTLDDSGDFDPAYVASCPAPATICPF